MKTRTLTRQVPGVHPETGEKITRREEYQVPVLPKDWDRIALRAAVALVLGLTLVSVVWSTYSIGELLKGGVGYAAASIFDVAWAVCLILEWMARYEPKKRAFPRKLGWGLLVCTMLAIGAHGALMVHSMAAAIVGAGVSLFAKVLWLGVLQHIDRDLEPDDQALVAARKSTAYRELALASTQRQTAQVRRNAALELLAMEQAGLVLEAATPLTAEVVEEGPARTEQVLARAVEALRHDSEQGTEPHPATVAALDAARADGWSVREVWEAAMAPQRASGHPDAAVSAQVSAPQAAQSIRPGFRQAEQQERVPAQRATLSLAAAVGVLMAGGITDREHLDALLPALVGEAYKAESLDREMRKHRP